ncbi:MAG: hypothetical protein KDA75_02305 [Planctomycetaceae bacterium]|nr:hypothetical protein [Planctomycetaceae bacterium]
MALFALSILYVLSEAPLLWITGEKFPARRFWKAYEPMGQLYYHDPWSSPLTAWSRMWGVEDEVHRGSIIRMMAEGTELPVEFWEELARDNYERRLESIRNQSLH